MQFASGKFGQGLQNIGTAAKSEKMNVFAVFAQQLTSWQDNWPVLSPTNPYEGLAFRHSLYMSALCWHFSCSPDIFNFELNTERCMYVVQVGATSNPHT